MNFLAVRVTSWICSDINLSIIVDLLSLFCS